jgi:hypothetical protein
MKLNPMEAFVDFACNSTGLSFNKVTKLNCLWKKYHITENNRISVFSVMERLKLVYSTINKTININYLLQNQYAL